MARLRQAERDDLHWVWPAARGALLFDDPSGLEKWWAEAPWRVQVDSRGEAAILGRWRAHLDIMAIKGIWCSGRRIPTLLEDLRAVALSNGLRRLLSPLLPAQAARPYKKAGMTAVDEIVVMRTDPRRVRTAPPPVCGVDVRVAFDEDLDGVLAVDASAFEEFWRYDRDMLSEFSRDERLAVAEAGSEIVGYTLSTVRRGVGSIGRLAVRSDRQGLGIGKMMLEDSLKYLAACGAERATLCTQCDNARSRRLYAGAGFETMPGILLGLLSEPF